MIYTPLFFLENPLQRVPPVWLVTPFVGRYTGRGDAVIMTGGHWVRLEEFVVLDTINPLPVYRTISSSV